MKLIDQDVPGPRRDFVGYGRHQPKVTWPNGARVAVSLRLNYEEGSEYSKPAGDDRNEGLAEIIYSMDPQYRDLCAESVYEYGSRAGVWRLQRLFDAYKIPITFYAAAVALERNPEVAAWLHEAGHEPCSHGWRWEEMWKLSREEEKAHMEAAIKSITETCWTAATRLVLPLWTVGAHPRASGRGRRIRVRLRYVQRRSAVLRGGRR